MEGDDDENSDQRNKLKTAVEDLMARHGGGYHADPHESRLRRVVERMPGTDDDRPRDGKNYDRIAALLTDRLHGSAPIPLRHARDGAWCLWETTPAIAAQAPLLERYLDQLTALADRRASRALCRAYLAQYGDNRPGLMRVSAALEDLSTTAGEPYAGLQDDLALFSLPEGPLRLGQRAIEQRRSPVAVLEASGVTQAHLLQGGFAEPCARAALVQLAAEPRLDPRERLELVKTLALNPKDGHLFFPQHKAAFANALLLPYRASDPPADVRSETLNLVTRLLGDPRTNPWIGVDSAKAVVLRWLTRLALRQFLDVVGAINPDPNWRYRRRFWEAMYEHEVIGNAWTVLSTDGVNEAKRRFGRDTPYAEFVSGRVAADHAVLLMEVGRGICAEWSYNGKCRFWADRSRNGAPQMFLSEYDADFLRTGDAYAPVDEITHWPHQDNRTGERTAWQHRVARRIHSMTGIRVHALEYM